MSRIACTLLLAAALPLTACSSSSGGAAAAPTPDLATPAGLSSTVARKVGISENQANAAIGSILGQAQGKLSPEDYTKLASAIPGADSYLSAATAAGVGPVAAADSATAGAAGEASSKDVLNSNLAKLGIPPESADQVLPTVVEYVGQVGGPKNATLLESVY